VVIGRAQKTTRVHATGGFSAIDHNVQFGRRTPSTEVFHFVLNCNMSLKRGNYLLQGPRAENVQYETVDNRKVENFDPERVNTTL
jgi:hypothetical protein